MIREPLSLKILSRKSMRIREDVVLAIKLYCETFPEMPPESGVGLNLTNHYVTEMSLKGVFTGL
jgi:hypothetical protein